MKIKMLCSRSDGLVYGQEVEIEDAEAIRMIEAGQAEPVRAVAVEKAVPRAKAEKA